VQLPDGSIAGQSSPTKRPFKPQITYHTTFTPALILGALGAVPEAADIRSPIADWLLAQHSAGWSFNYWARTSKEYATMAYPDDLDDTFCALTSLYLHDPSSITAEALGSIVRLLIATEQTVGGPYRTWLTTPDSDAVWRDVDLAVNSNIAYFLRLVAKPLPNLTAYLETAITEGNLASPYYPGAAPILYYLARAYRGPQEQLLASCIRKQPVTTALHTALIVSSLLELGHNAELGPAVAKLRSWQLADGSWPAEAYCIDPARRGTTFYHGSRALTTALAVEALARYDQHHPDATDHKPLHKTQLATDAIQAAVAATNDLDEPIRSHTVSMLETTAVGDESHEIAGIPYLFKQSLAVQPVLPKELLARLGAANLFGWLAYTIYDDFLDDEGIPAELSVANVALRRSLDGFMRTLPSHTDFQHLIRSTFDRIDAANAWEIDHCRFAVTDDTITIGILPRYGTRTRLAERSLGHTLGPMAILSSVGYAPHSTTAKAIHRMLTHYLIARQLNDDVHDWEQDLRRGHISCVVQTIFKALKLPPGEHNLDDLLLKAKRQFWHHSLVALCDRTDQHIAKAREAGQASGVLDINGPIMKLLDNLATVVIHTRSEQTKAEQFLNAYRKN
jgi:hypothetical protein